jgi:hypothetical protein
MERHRHALFFSKQAPVTKPPRLWHPLSTLEPSQARKHLCPGPIGLYLPCSESQHNVEHLAGVDSSVSLQACRPPPHPIPRQRPSLSCIDPLAQPLILFLSYRSWPRSLPNVAGQQTPRLGKAPAASQYISTPGPLPLSVSLTHPSILSLSIPSGAIPDSPTPPLPGPRSRREPRRERSRLRLRPLSSLTLCISNLLSLSLTLIVHPPFPGTIQRISVKLHRRQPHASMPRSSSPA